VKGLKKHTIKGQAFKEKAKNLNIKSDWKENKPKNNNFD